MPRVALLLFLMAAPSGWEEGMAARPVAERRADDRWSRAAISGLLCFYRGDRKAALQEIATEQNYGRLSGFVNKLKLYDLSQRVRRDDEQVALWVARLPPGPRGKPLGCTDRVAEIAECVGLDLAGDPCADHIMQAYVETVAE